MDAQGRVETRQHARVAGPRVIPQRRYLPCTNLRDVAVDDQDPRPGHAGLSTASSLPLTAARKMFPAARR